MAGGVAGAKAWYIGVHKGRKFDGWCIQGFVAGAAAVAAIVPAAGLGMPAGSYYAAGTPGLLIGTTSAPSAPAGDAWATNVGFVAPLPMSTPGRYTATVTFTVIGR